MKLVVYGNVKAKKNEKMIGYRNTPRGKKPFIMTKEETNEYIVDAIAQLKKQFKGYKVTNYPVEIQFIFYYKYKHRKDLDNSMTTILDCMKDAGIIEDDDVGHTDELHASFGGYDKENPRVEIILEDD